jgi:hypothetical protein
MAYKIAAKSQPRAVPKSMSVSNFEDDKAAPSVLDSLTDRLETSSVAFTELQQRLVRLADRIFGPNPPSDDEGKNLWNGSTGTVARLERLAVTLSEQVVAFDRAIERLELL